jgi:hypothetical protein
MALVARFRARLRLLARDERGMALPTAIFAMVASMGFAGAAVISTVNAQRGTNRDHDSKSAIAAADAGADVALLRLNRFIGSLGPSKRCVGPAGEAQAETAVNSGWCPMTVAESVGGAAFRYQVSAYHPSGQLQVISYGDSGEVSRRIEVGLISHNDKKVFADERLIGEESVTLKGTPDVRTDIGTNGDVTSDGSGTLCGNVRHGVGKSAPDPDCGKSKTEGSKDLPSVVPPANIATENWNCRLSVTCPLKSDVDIYVGANKKEKRTATKPWDPETRTINIDANSELTMGGGDYFVCGLSMQNGKLIMAGGPDVQVRIFFDTPENCGFEDGDTQIDVTGGRITSTGYNPDLGMFNVPGFYVMGSTSDPPITTTIKLGGNAGGGGKSDEGSNELILYAPDSHVEVKGGATWIGMMAGKTIELDGTPKIESHPGIKPPEISFSSLWEATHYVECTGATPSAAAPDENC